MWLFHHFITLSFFFTYGRIKFPNFWLRITKMTKCKRSRSVEFQCLDIKKINHLYSIVRRNINGKQTATLFPWVPKIYLRKWSKIFSVSHCLHFVKLKILNYCVSICVCVCVCVAEAALAKDRRASRAMPAINQSVSLFIERLLLEPGL